MAYSPPATAPTRIVGPDLVALKGDVTLGVGNNVAITRQGNGLYVASTSAALRSVTAFAPGAAVLRTLQRGSVPSPVLQALDILLGTAPVGVTGANCGNVQVKGTASGGPVVVPLAAGVAEYHLGLTDLTASLAGDTSGGSTANGNPGAVAFPFRVSTQVVVKNAAVALSGGDAGSPRIGIATGVVQGSPGTNVFNPNWVQDAAGNQCFQDAADSNGFVLATFPGSTGFTLNPGVTYFLNVARQSVAGGPYTGDPTRQHATGNLGLTVGTADGTHHGNILTGFGTPLQVGSTGQGLFGPYNNTFDTTWGAFQWPTFDLYGAVMGTPLGGFVEIGQTITGAPPGTTGSDANIVAQV